MVMGLGWLRRTCVRRTGWCGLATALALAPASAPASPLAKPAPPSLTTARPALWVVSDHDTIVYLFGTFHALDGRTPWFTRGVRNAFESSDELVLETVIPDNPEAIRAALQRHRDGSAPASTGLAAARTAMTAARSVGLSAQSGADAVLQRAAAAAGKPVSGLERFEQQLAMYDRLPAPPPSPRSASPASPDPAIAAFVRQMMLAWADGDPSTFETVIGAMRTQSPQTYRLLFAERNETWAEWIADRLRQPGVVFVAVGTGHLVGADSVQAKLAVRGIRSARVN